MFKIHVWPHDSSAGSLFILDTVFIFGMCILGYYTYDVNQINNMLTMFTYFDKKIRNSYFFKNIYYKYQFYWFQQIPELHCIFFITIYLIHFKLSMLVQGLFFINILTDTPPDGHFLKKYLNMFHVNMFHVSYNFSIICSTNNNNRISPLYPFKIQPFGYSDPCSQCKRVNSVELFLIS